MVVVVVVATAQLITLAIRDDGINPWITAPLLKDTMMTGITATSIDDTMIKIPGIIANTMVGMIMVTLETMIGPSVGEVVATPGSRQCIKRFI